MMRRYVINLILSCDSINCFLGSGKHLHFFFELGKHLHLRHSYISSSLRHSLGYLQVKVSPLLSQKGGKHYTVRLILISIEYNSLFSGYTRLSRSLYIFNLGLYRLQIYHSSVQQDFVALRS